MISILLKILNCDNKVLFQDNEISFYIICKKFANFYNKFLQGKKQDILEKKNWNSSSIKLEVASSSNEKASQNKKTIH